MVCGLHNRQVGHGAFGVDHSSWQVHRISRTNFFFSSGGVVGAACDGIFGCSDWHKVVILFPLHCTPYTVAPC